MGDSTDQHRRAVGGYCSADTTDVAMRTRPSRLVRTAPRPDMGGTSITGRWDDIHERGAVLHVNRAGDFVALWHVGANGSQKKLTGERDKGNRVEEVYTLYDENGDAKLGTLLVQAGTSFVSVDSGWRNRSPFSKSIPTDLFLSLSLGEQTADFFRVDQSPAYSQSVLQAFPAELRDAIRREKLTPIPAVYLDRVEKALNPEFLSQAIRQYHAAVDGWTPNIVAIIEQENILRAINNPLEHAFTGVPPFHEERLEVFARMHLQRHSYTHEGKTQALLSWLTEMVSGVGPSAKDDVDAALRGRLRLERTNGKIFYYSVNLKLGSLSTDLAQLGATISKGARFQVGIGGGYCRGNVFVQAMAPAPTPMAAGKRFHPVGDVMVFPIWFLAFGVGIGVGIGVDTSTPDDNPVATTRQWKPHHFPGAARMVDAGMMGSFWGIGATGLILTGSGANPELVIDLTGMVNGLGVGVGLTGYAGSLGQPLSIAPQWTPPNQPNQTAVAGHRVAMRVHYGLGDSELDDLGRYALRILAANELALLEQEHDCLLKVVGHADRVDDAGYNCALTSLRAENCVQGLRDVLGSRLQVPAIETLGLGEQEAAASDEDGKPNPYFRRVDVTLNGRVVARLRGQ